MATSTIKPVHAGIQVPFTIATSSWATTSPYTYTWTDSRVTAGCRVEVAFDSSSTDASVEYISFEKVSGGIKFTAPSKPTASIAVVVTLVNAQTGNVQAIQASDVSISNTGISGAANVNEALTSLNEQLGWTYLQGTDSTAGITVKAFNNGNWREIMLLLQQNNGPMVSSFVCTATKTSSTELRAIYRTDDNSLRYGSFVRSTGVLKVSNTGYNVNLYAR